MALFLFFAFPEVRAHDGAMKILMFSYIVGAMALTYYLPPRIMRFHLARDDEQLEFPLGTYAGQTREAERERQEQQAHDKKYPEWKCLKCGEENPGEFESCWNCKSSAPGSSGAAPSDNQ